jgi:Rrf2 family protein
MARHDQPFTSAQIARMLDTNAVVVRRTMAGLRDAGYVRSVNGHGGGWTLARRLEELTLLDVHRAVGGPQLFAIGHEGGNPHCAVARAVNSALDDVLGRAEALVTKKLGEVALADLLETFDATCRSAGWRADGPRKRR